MDDAAKRPAPAGNPTPDPVVGADTDRPLTIGQVVAQLQTEFPDLSITKIRYLEDRQLRIRPGAKAATGSSVRPTSGGSGPYSLCSATSIYRLR